MSAPPTPEEKFERAVEEGRRRLDQSLLELVSTSFIAGFTIVFGVVALGMVDAAVRPQLGEVARVAGALAFGLGLAFLVVGRAELFNENFLDPTATVVEDAWSESGEGGDESDVGRDDGSDETDEGDGRNSSTGGLPALLQLWVVTFAFNLVGGILFALVFVPEGVMPPGSAGALRDVATHTLGGAPLGWFASAIAGGALVSLLSYLLVAVDSAGTRFGLAYVVGVLLALGPFDHVIVTAIHAVFGLWFGAEAGLARVVWLVAVVTAGNLVGGLGLVTFTHVTQAMGAEESDE